MLWDAGKKRTWGSSECTSESIHTVYAVERKYWVDQLQISWSETSDCGVEKWGRSSEKRSIFGWDGGGDPSVWSTE